MNAACVVRAQNAKQNKTASEKNRFTKPQVALAPRLIQGKCLAFA
jgi:hypothetical protein